MANSSNSMRKSMLFWLGASLLVLAGMCLDCAKPTQTAITITGKKPDNYNLDSDPVSVIRKNGDSVSWTNKSSDGTDVMVCIDEGANPDDHVFNETRYVAKSGGKVPSSVAKSSAQLVHRPVSYLYYCDLGCVSLVSEGASLDILWSPR